MAIIIKPIVTEKMTELGEKSNRYGFQVERTANKIQIKKAVEDKIAEFQATPNILANWSEVDYSKL